MTDPAPGALVFDLDGTLVDTSCDLIAAANRVFGNLGLAVRLDPATDRAVSFRGGRALLECGLDRLEGSSGRPGCMDTLYALFLEEYLHMVDTHSRPYEGVEEALARLRARGWRLAVCTNKPEKPARLLLASLGLTPFFDVIIGADTHPFRKPDPRVYDKVMAALDVPRSASFMIGDSWTDAEVARRACVPFVLYAPEAPDDLCMAVGTQFRFDCYAALPTRVERLRGQRRETAA